MQLGYTIPLMKYLKIQNLPYGRDCDLRLCWELHILKPGGVPSLFAVHASSRFAFLLYGLSTADWKDVPGLFRSELEHALLEEFTPAEVERYLSLAGELSVTKTHGRRPVAFLNRAVDDFHALPVGLEGDRLEQRLIRMQLNSLIRRCAGHEGSGAAREFLLRDLEGLEAEEL